MPFFHIMAVCRGRCGWMPNHGLREGNCARLSPLLRSNSESISARLTWSVRSDHLDRSRSRCSASADPALVSAKPNGRIFATTRDELIECAAVVSAIRSGDLEAVFDSAERARYSGPANCRCGGHRYVARGRSLCSFPFRLSLSQPCSRGFRFRLRHAFGRNRNFSRTQRSSPASRWVNGRVKGRRGARLAAITSGGAIPENANYAVIAEPDGKTVGTLDEDFAIEVSSEMSSC